MTDKPFIHLHTHSHYSLLNALPKIPELVARAKECGMDALALTDNGNLYGAIEFYKACTKAEIKPIIGVDFYLARRTRHDKEPGIDNKRHRLVLLAENTKGYSNLIKLVTKSHVEGFYYKPRIDHELLEKHHDGLIAILPSFSSEVSALLKMHDRDAAEEKLTQYKNIFGSDNTFLEVTHHPEIEGHDTLQEEIVAIGKKTRTPLLASHDVYYLTPEDKRARTTLLSIQSSMGARERGGFTNDDEDFSFITSEQAEEYFRTLPEALENTRRVAERCTVEIKLGDWLFPNLEIPKETTYDKELSRLVEAGLARRKLTITPDVKERMEFELKTIKDKGYSPYFLIVGDLMRFAHQQGILTTIRGSVAGSLITYLMGITHINPLEYGLPFERFLNPDRPSAPDIDMDFADDRRDEVIAYAREKYGADNVAQIGTFGTMLARGSIRDTARALGYDYSTGDRIAKLIPFGSQGFPMSIERAMEEEPQLKTLYETDEEAQIIIDMAQKIEGCARHISVHAAGVVISPIPLNEIVPVQFDTKGDKKLITQYDMHSVEDVGLLKFDFLGLTNLAVLADAIKRVKKLKDIAIDIEHIPLDDTKTFEMLARGETLGVFQLAGQAMTKFLKELKPSTIHDINAMVALYRPGPMKNIPHYIARKHGDESVTYYHPKMEEFLDKSYGLLVYQDDLLFTALELAGYNWKNVDKFRKAVGKKIPEEMAKQHKIFVAGCMEHSDMSKEEAEGLWDLFEPFQGYGFNKCLTGDTRLVDAATGAMHTIDELYTTNQRIAIHTMNKQFKLEKQPVTAIQQNGRKPVYEITTRTGKRITATANHPLYTINGWKNVSELSTGDRVATVQKRAVGEDIYWDEIVSITPRGAQMTYDLTVPPHHNFLANDFIVHNSHAASYGRVAYQTAYMKANHPVIYMAALLSAEAGNVEKVSEIIGECKRMHIDVLPPDVNESLGDFTVVLDKNNEVTPAIRFGLYSIKNFGKGIADTIITERKANGRFTFLANFLERINDRNLNKKSLESLIKCGALDEFNERGMMLANIDDLLEYSRAVHNAPEHQDSLFALMPEDAHVSELTLKPAETIDDDERLAWEKELLGLYISGHPLDKFKDKIAEHGWDIERAKDELEVGATTIVCGVIEESRQILTKNGEHMAFLKVSDYTTSIEVVVFPRTFEACADRIATDTCVAVRGTLSDRGGDLSILANTVKVLR